MPAYEPNPCYQPIDGEVGVGWDAAVEQLPAIDPGRGLGLALDGPGVLDWDTAIHGLGAALDARSISSRTIGLASHLAPWDDIVARTSTPELAEDPDFARLASTNLREFYADLRKTLREPGAVTIVAGPGAALVEHDVLWYIDQPKRHAEEAIKAGAARNLGQGEGTGTTRRLFYIDWPVLDRHRAEFASRVDRWIDLQDPERPTSIDGAGLRRTAGWLAGRPFRTRPTFNSAPWGGHWGQRRLGLGVDQKNSAIGYELISPEAGILLGDESARVEIPFQLVVDLFPESVLGSFVHESFGTSFPIRFDYLDTVDGGNLSIHCHPRDAYMKRVFGWPYAQHESYYVMVGGEGSRIFLGLRGDVDLEAFEADAERAVGRRQPFRIEDHVQTFPAEQDRLFMIPAGTPHGSGDGNVVLEVSATPYLYSLRFYDWLRRDAEGTQRPVHVDHAFANLNRDRRGVDVARDLVQEPRIVGSGDGWREEILGTLPEVFYEVRRLVLASGSIVEAESGDRFHVLNVVAGEGVEIEWGSASDTSRHRLNYAETIVVPAAVGPYAVRAVGADEVRVVKALVR